VVVVERFLEGISMSPGPYVVLRSPYIFPMINTVGGTQITRSVRCVDLLDPSGVVIKNVACEILEKA